MSWEGSANTSSHKKFEVRPTGKGIISERWTQCKISLHNHWRDFEWLAVRKPLRNELCWGGGGGQLMWLQKRKSLTRNAVRTAPFGRKNKWRYALRNAFTDVFTRSHHSMLCDFARKQTLNIIVPFCQCVRPLFYFWNVKLKLLFLPNVAWTYGMSMPLTGVDAKIWRVTRARYSH